MLQKSIFVLFPFSQNAKSKFLQANKSTYKTAA